MSLKTWTPDEVQSADDKAKAFCEYLQQAVGIPLPTGKDIALVRRKAKDFFNEYPHTDWRTLCRVGNYCRQRKKRLPRSWMVIDKYREAWSAGFLPELNQTERREEDVERAIAAALEHEQREGWRRRLLMARTAETRRKALGEWESEQLASSSSR